MHGKIFRFASRRRIGLFEPVYNRGGYVWTEDSSEFAMLFLEEDWTGDRLPDDLVEEAGLLSSVTELLKPNERAQWGGYARSVDQVLFSLGPEADFIEQDERFFLVGDLNQWDWSANPAKWELMYRNQNFSLNLNWEELAQLGSFEFKFVTDRGRWFGPQEFYPSIKMAENGATNYLFDSRRSGRDIFRVKIVKPFKDEKIESLKAVMPSGEFGYKLENGKAVFRLHAPRAIGVELLVYDDMPSPEPEHYPLQFEDEGSWVVTLKRNMDGCLYRFAVTNRDHLGNPFTKLITDPYARAMVGRDGPGIAVKKLKFHAEPFVPPPMEEIVIVEAHLRDLLQNAGLQMKPEERQNFAGLTRWLRSEDCYLRKLGANVVELQPVQEFDARKKDEYHWGYMPVNFFSPASVYASNPLDGSVMQEFRDLVDAFHQAGISVVLDVVYNHVGIPPHLIFLDRELYFLRDTEGNLTNHSGCGNDLDCSAEPTKKLILDSLVYLIQSFDVDGFRFDLGELIGAEFLSEIEKELKIHKPGILLFAEPWSFRGRLPDIMNQTSFGLWSDACRENLLGYAKGRSGCEVVEAVIDGQLDTQNKEFCQSVNYLESHDDYALLDRFRDLAAWTGEKPPMEVRKRYLLAMGVLLSAPGVPMLPAGGDFLRHKKGVRNTYLKGDLNALDYHLEDSYEDEMRFIRAMIRLRLSVHGEFSRRNKKTSWDRKFFFTEGTNGIGWFWRSPCLENEYLIQVNAGQDFQHLCGWDNLWEEGNYETLLSSLPQDEIPGVLPPLSFTWFLKKDCHSQRKS